MALDRYETELRDAGKARNTINSYVQPVERFLNWLTGNRPKRGGGGAPFDPPGRSPSTPNPSRGSRYDGLREYLANRAEPVVRLSFAEIERIIGGSLPPSARRHRPWWANQHAGTHVHARSWLDAGRRTANVDMNGATVDFVN